jgi:CRP-like cAMP-binding protein
MSACPAPCGGLPCDRCSGRSLGICAPLDNQGLASLVSMGGQRRWDKRQLLYHADGEASAVYKITKGIVIECSDLSDGRRQIVAIRSVGDLCGYPARDGRYALTAQAVTPVEACAFGTAKFQERLGHNIELARALVDDASERLKQAWLGLVAVGQLK